MSTRQSGSKRPRIKSTSDTTADMPPPANRRRTDYNVSNTTAAQKRYVMPSTAATRKVSSKLLEQVASPQRPNAVADPIFCDTENGRSAGSGGSSEGSEFGVSKQDTPAAFVGFGYLRNETPLELPKRPASPRAPRSRSVSTRLSLHGEQPPSARTSDGIPTAVVESNTDVTPTKPPPNASHTPVKSPKGIVPFVVEDTLPPLKAPESAPTSHASSVKTAVVPQITTQQKPPSILPKKTEQCITTAKSSVPPPLRSEKTKDLCQTSTKVATVPAQAATKPRPARRLSTYLLWKMCLLALVGAMCLVALGIVHNSGSNDADPFAVQVEAAYESGRKGTFSFSNPKCSVCMKQYVKHMGMTALLERLPSNNITQLQRATASLALQHRLRTLLFSLDRANGYADWAKGNAMSVASLEWLRYSDGWLESFGRLVGCIVPTQSTACEPPKAVIASTKLEAIYEAPLGLSYTDKKCVRTCKAESGTKQQGRQGH